MFSVQLNLLGFTMAGAYSQMYDKLKDTIPPSTMMWITGGVFALSVLARMIDQDIKPAAQQGADDATK